MVADPPPSSLITFLRELLGGGCSRRTSRMRSFCWSRVIVVTEDIAGRVAGVSSGRSAENPCDEEVRLVVSSAALP